MPNGHGQREEDEEKLIQAIEEEGWNYYENPDNWIVKAARSDRMHEGTGFKARRETYYGDNYVYLVVSSVHGNHVHVFSQKKSK